MVSPRRRILFRSRPLFHSDRKRVRQNWKNGVVFVFGVCVEVRVAARASALVVGQQQVAVICWCLSSVRSAKGACFVRRVNRIKLVGGWQWARDVGLRRDFGATACAQRPGPRRRRLRRQNRPGCSGYGSTGCSICLPATAAPAAAARLRLRRRRADHPGHGEGQ